MEAENSLVDSKQKPKNTFEQILNGAIAENVNPHAATGKWLEELSLVQVS